MRRSAFVLLAAAWLVSTACAQGAKESWRESGQSWSQSGRQFLRALGRSISGEGSPKEEWKETGRDLGQAGKDTAEAIGDSIPPKGIATPAGP